MRGEEPWRRSLWESGWDFSYTTGWETLARSVLAAYLIVRDFHAADGERRLEVGEAQKWRPGAAGDKLNKTQQLWLKDGNRGFSCGAFIC